MDKKRELTPEEMDRVSGGTGGQNNEGRCPWCNQIFDPVTLKCPKCGFSNANSINCPTCGCLIDINSSTCPACHALILNYNTNTNTNTDIAKV